jgi:hypothetical protein
VPVMISATTPKPAATTELLRIAIMLLFEW